MNNIHRVYEYTWLQYEEGLKFYQPWFTKRHYEALVDFHDHRKGHKYFQLVRSGVKFSHYVGVIQVLDLTIEILPKTDKEGSGKEALWHGVLLDMLRQTRFLRLDYLSEAALRYRRHSILHLYFMEFLHEVQLLIKRGLVKKYRRKTSNLHVLKGSLQFNRHITQNLVHKERFYTKYPVYDHQHILHQILLEALLILKNLVSQSSLTDEVNRTLFNFPEMPLKKITEKTFEALPSDRKTNRYKKAITIAKMIILNYAPDIKGGNNNLFALLFDMNELWEEFIYRQLVKAGALVNYQASKDFWATRTIRPDLIVEYNSEKMVLDTKWKIIDNAQPSDEDLKQIFVYNTYWGVRKGFLIYPKTPVSPITTPGEYHKGYHGREKMTCQVVYANVVNEEEETLNENLGEQLLAELSTH